jgi:hypothetical protein
MRQVILGSILMCSIVLLSAGAASPATDSGKCYGIRGGYSSKPDQFVIGAQADMGEIYSEVHFVPSIDAGFGDHLKTIAFNGDLELFVPLPKSSSSLYGIAGPTIMIWTPDVGNGDTEIGLTLGLGARMPLGGSGWYNVEARFGIGDIPDVKVLLGVFFGGR